MKRSLGGLLFAVVAAAGATGVATGMSRAHGNDEAFDHAQHAELFPSCLACHRGVVEARASVFPDPAGCANCHDGSDDLEPVEWEPRDGPRATNLRFEHREHVREVAREGDQEPLLCVECHAPEAAPWMTVQRAVVASCFDCHNLGPEHLAAADDTCATCHTDLADSPTLQLEQVAGFEAPPSHAEAGFAFEHGDVTDATCAICHARDFCVQCHVNAPDVEQIASLKPDERSLAIAAELPAPASHASSAFLSNHGREARESSETCAVCHTASSCTTCHVGEPELAAFLPTEGPGRGSGARIDRTPPPSHDQAFLTAHGSEAAARPETCAGCHVRSDCTECHRPGAPTGTGFHPADFMTRHPAAAYARETSCADCHATAEFCTSCHAEAGLTASDILTSSFHDGQAAFSVGHGAAARRDLETCTSCHVERDCMVCHSSTGGRGINPHGPDFDAEKLRRTNPQACTACHGREIPGAP